MDAWRLKREVTASLVSFAAPAQRQYTDPETGLIYLRARYYDPTTAQFLTRDPLDALTRSAYGYVGDNPMNGADPTGLGCGIFDPGGCVRAAVHAATSTANNLYQDYQAGGGVNASVHVAAAEGVVLGAVAVGISTAGVGDAVIAGISVGALGTAVSATSAAISIGVAGYDCANDPGTAQCTLDAIGAALSTIGVGGSIGGQLLTAGGGELAELGEVARLYGDISLGAGAVTLGAATLFGKQFGLTGIQDACK